MKLLVVADIHYSLPQFDWLVEQATSCDAMIIAGDLLDTNAMVDAGAQLIVVQKYLKRLSGLTKVLVCSGNHDIRDTGRGGERQADWLADLRRSAIFADGDTVELGDTLVTICPWWDGPETQRTIGEQLDAAAGVRKGPWIWLYHAPPPDTPISWAGQRYFGDAALTGWIVRHQPDMVFCGHVHEAPFVRNGSWVDRIGRTWVFNAGKQIGPVPTVIRVDTAAQAAAWFSLDGAEEVALDAPLVRPLPPLMAMPDWL